ncbi:ankyrin repeat domain-containing protein 50-like [Haliotis asinina]|uniref:ankyrin repeat domain-containing protein 50-like n=1 Tax=Haliotis asinina TaxID=109174 RepID=UPI00353272F3
MVKYILLQDNVDINSRVRCGRTAVMLAAEDGHKDVVELLVDKGADVSLVDEAGDNVLHCACRGGNKELVKYILSNKMVDIDSRGYRDKTPVMTAGQSGHKEVVELLVKHGANLLLRDERGDNILHLACKRGRLDVVKYIISLHKLDIDRGGFKKKTPVMLAGQGGHKEVVEVLVKHGANLLLRDERGDNILHLACWEGHLGVVKYIISLHKMDIDKGGFEKKTPVMLAGEGGHKEVVEVLVTDGANLALRNSDYNNILHLTSYGGYVDVVKYVLSQRVVDIDSRGWKRRTAVMIAGMEGHKGLVELYVKHGAKLSLTDRVGDNILHLACKRGRLDVVKYIISLHKMDIDKGAFEKKTPVMLAGERGHKEVVEVLVTDGANLALRNSDYNNILHLTSYGGYVDVVKYVLSQRVVDIDSRGWKRRTAVMIAGMKGHKGLVELYVKHGAKLSLTDRAGDNILLLAVSHVEVVKYILSLGVMNINVKNRKGKSAAMIARAKGLRDVIDILVSHGAHT